MGVKERRERARQELRQMILTAARDTALQEGWKAVTIRRVAEVIEYSPASIYEYFDSKDAILQELTREGFANLLGQMRAAAASVAGNRKRMVKMSQAYCGFAWEHSELYQVMFGMAGASCDRGGDLPELEEISKLMVSMARDALRISEGDTVDLGMALEILLSTLHGLVALSMEGYFPGGRERAEMLAERATRDWLGAWQRG